MLKIFYYTVLVNLLSTAIILYTLNIQVHKKLLIHDAYTNKFRILSSLYRIMVLHTEYLPDRLIWLYQIHKMLGQN